MKIVGPESYSSDTCYVKFSKKKKLKTAFVVSCPKIQCSQKTLLRALGVKITPVGEVAPFPFIFVYN